ncbi:expressed unknown protein [Seminavis robusta]|uniref:Uncharacterized protein n=1 Tax=Seminavis robusta TaxID=568900 RepID=A0A9N8E2I9_9STRA|nr:expressed unknown protein [Seminavis robusta]|eukprot:Sro480_g151360.1 n/a (548) ;mRNA; f:25149-26870
MPRKHRKRKPAEEVTSATSTSSGPRVKFLFARVALILLACHSTYVFWTTSSVSQLRALLEASKEVLQQIIQEEEPAWVRALELQSDDQNQTSRYLGISRGILSNKPMSFFREIQDKIDQEDLAERCHRYGFSVKKQNSDNNSTSLRRIFYGSLIAAESWETLDIVATEAYGLFAGVVFVESNRTQHFIPRPFHWNAENTERLRRLYGTPQLQVRQFINEDSGLMDLYREHEQREEIVKGWKELGMGPEDIGYLGDVDEAFTRDFLRAVQSCNVEEFDYKTHHCDQRKAKMQGFTRVFETSPDCLVKDRSWFHPDMVIGACVENIGDEKKNIIAPRDPINGRPGPHRSPGFGSCYGPVNVENITDNRFPLYNAGDIRMGCGGRFFPIKNPPPKYTTYSAFHMHNFFVDLHALRFKYLTYGHPIDNAMTAPLEDLHSDLRLMVRCVKNLTDAPTENHFADKQSNHRVQGGVDGALPPFPIYFMDKDYRNRKHEAARLQVEEDEQRRRDRLGMDPVQRRYEDVTLEYKEARRHMWSKEKEAERIKSLLSS